MLKNEDPQGSSGSNSGGRRRGSGLGLLRAADCRIHKSVNTKFFKKCKYTSSKNDGIPQVTQCFKEMSASYTT